MNSKVKIRLNWVRAYEQPSDAGLTCERFGTSRPTLRKWVNRFNSLGLSGLEDRDKKPKSSPNKKRNETIEQQILKLRSERNLGARRIRNEMMSTNHTV